MITIAIRIILSLMLLWFVYFETGVVTVFVLFLAMVNGELQTYLLSLKQNRTLK